MGLFKQISTVKYVKKNGEGIFPLLRKCVINSFTWY